MAAIVVAPHHLPRPARSFRPEQVHWVPRSAAPPRRLDATRPVRLVFTIGAVLLLAIMVVGSLLGSGVATADTAASAVELAIPVGAPVVDGAWVVQPGDTLWAIASALDPGGDPRPLVDELARRAGGAALQPGQRIALDGLGR